MSVPTVDKTPPLNKKIITFKYAENKQYHVELSNHFMFN